MDLARRRELSRRGALHAPASGHFLNRKRILVIAGLLLGAFLALWYVWQSWQSVYWLNQLHDAEQELAGLQNDRENVRYSLAQAFSLTRLEEAAKRLGMIRPDPDAKTLYYLYLVK